MSQPRINYLSILSIARRKSGYWHNVQDIHQVSICWIDLQRFLA
jgi:hypothetical protein